MRNRKPGTEIIRKNFWNKYLTDVCIILLKQFFAFFDVKETNDWGGKQSNTLGEFADADLKQVFYSIFFYTYDDCFKFSVKILTLMFQKFFIIMDVLKENIFFLFVMVKNMGSYTTVRPNCHS